MGKIDWLLVVYLGIYTWVLISDGRRRRAERTANLGRWN